MAKEWWKESGHIAVEHKHCRQLYCPICEGGLTACSRCGLYEGSLTTHCPGVQSYAEHSDAVYRGEEDFFEGQWVKGRRTVFMYPQDYMEASNA